MSKKKLVIVESPSKTKTLSKILGTGYTIKATMGHIRDLPKSQLGVDPENNFAPKYILIRSKSKVTQELKKAVKAADTVYLATDPDREGEAIAWHIMEATKTANKEYRRIAFYEITKEAILKSFKESRSLDMQLVNAQAARRILDRLVGYKLSPLLWRKVRRGLSAGRVQSVAVRIVVDREREIRNFKEEEYWAIDVALSQKAVGKELQFRAQLNSIAGSTKFKIHNQKEADEVLAELKGAAYQVAKVSKKEAKRQPQAPFITSTLQQEAWRKLRFSAKQTMAVAQQLYEGLPIGKEGTVGLITYMRTDSTRVAKTAVAEARDYITDKYGQKYLPAKARVFARKVKGAQEAHEAIRPTRIWREPALIKEHLKKEQFKLYQLIWQRMLASQMESAVFDNTTVDIEAKHEKTKYIFRATSSENTFPGFTKLYTEGKDEEEKKSTPLPSLTKGDDCKLEEIFPEQRFTQPAPRYTEATLVKALEQWGIGRPSTYAPILSTIQDREYVTKTAGRFQPTELGEVVNDLLVKHFTDIVNVEFSARMEGELDKVANEDADWVKVVGDFYTPFEKDLAEATEKAEKMTLAPELLEENCPNCGKQLVVKMGRFGKFVACSDYPECKYTRSFQNKIGVKCPECGGDIIERRSKKGRRFYGCGSYPKCTFATNEKPLTKACPNCGGMLTAHKIKWEKCAKCDYKGRLEQE